LILLYIFVLLVIFVILLHPFHTHTILHGPRFHLLCFLSYKESGDEITLNLQSRLF